VINFIKGKLSKAVGWLEKGTHNKETRNTVACINTVMMSDPSQNSGHVVPLKIT